MEREVKQRESSFTHTQERIDRYLQNHPSASWAEADYKTREVK